MRIYALLLVLALQFLSLQAWSDDNNRSQKACDSYLLTDAIGHSIGITRVESLMGRQTRIIDVSDAVTERRAKTDPHLRVINLDNIFSEGKVFLGFGRPNVYLGLPSFEEDGLGYVKVDAKSLKRADTQVVATHQRAQSGLLLVFKDLSQEATEQILAKAKQHVGTRRWTCVNANCRILSDAGFTIGGESLEKYFFPVALFRDILKYGLEFQGRSVEFDIVKTTPGYLEEVGLSISHAVWSTLCRHGEKACSPIKAKFQKNTFVVKINNGIKNTLGVAIFSDNEVPPLEKPIWESQLTRVQVPIEKQQKYDLEVSEPSQFGTLLRLLWGPHSLFEVLLPDGKVDQHLTKKLTAYPDENPSLATRIKKNILFNPGVIRLIRSQLSSDYKKIPGLEHHLLFDMLRTDTEELPNKYNFVVTGNRLIIMKLSIRNAAVDWIMSKHVLMSSYSKDVRFAGEIWKDSKGKIHFNNNSGTYKPDSNVSLAVELFKKLFPGIEVEGHGLGG